MSVVLKIFKYGVQDQQTKTTVSSSCFNEYPQKAELLVRVKEVNNLSRISATHHLSMLCYNRHEIPSPVRENSLSKEKLFPARDSRKVPTI